MKSVHVDCKTGKVTTVEREPSPGELDARKLGPQPGAHSVDMSSLKKLTEWAAKQKIL